MFNRLITWLRSLSNFWKPKEFFTGFIASSPDSRDIIYQPNNQNTKAILPLSVDLRMKLGPVEQQGNTNACVAHAVTAALEGALGTLDHSRLFVYWNARTFTGATGADSGCTPRNAMRGISTFGSCPESVLPYDTTKILVKPDSAAYQEALAIRARIGAYQSITTLASLKAALAEGLPVAFGLMVPDTFVSETKTSGFLPLPTPTTKWLGGHAMVAVGYNDTRGTVLVRNSFGPTWGNAGHLEMPYGWFATMNSRVSDAWVFKPKA